MDSIKAELRSQSSGRILGPHWIPAGVPAFRRGASSRTISGVEDDVERLDSVLAVQDLQVGAEVTALVVLFGRVFTLDGKIEGRAGTVPQIRFQLTFGVACLLQ